MAQTDLLRQGRFLLLDHGGRGSCAGSDRQVDGIGVVAAVFDAAERVEQECTLV